MDFLTDYVKLLARIADASILLPVGVLLLRRKYIRGVAMRLLALFVLLTAARNLITEILSASRTPNIIYYNWFAILSYLNVAWLYYVLLKGKVRQFMIPVSCILLVGLSLLDSSTLFDSRTTVFNAYAHPLNGFFIIVLVLVFFVQLLESLQVPNIKQYTFFWFSAGALLYYTGTLLLYLFSRYTLSITGTTGWQNYFWSIDCLLSLLFNSFMAVSIWYAGQNHHFSEPILPVRAGSLP
ncbi:hypothetical protein GCM10023187_26590 [Nibrella viscosa]|uniref:Uncharacterized protein n=1 Tax=Nibrella viscosa TaxID=1084524 RepID=A0ABP8KHH3_9BACT